jgi:FkbM family methyltransferase
MPREPVDSPGPAPVWLRAVAAVSRRLPAGRYRAVAALGRRVRRPFLGRLPRRLGGAWFRCEPRDTIGAQAYFGGIYEPQETALAQAVLAPGATFVDVGANWGYFTLIAAGRVGAAGAVVALEPDPRMSEALRANVALNRLGNVTVLEIAATERAATVELMTVPLSAGNSGLSSLAPPNARGVERIAVQGRPLDDVLAELGHARIALLKMDIEGAEARALAGLRGCLADGRVERVLLELHPRALEALGSSVEEVFAQLSGAGLSPWSVDHSPEGYRRAAYARRLDAASYLRPFQPGDVLDAWPHLLWVRPGCEPVSLRPA